MKRQAVWNDLQAKMSGKRTRTDASARKNKKGSNAPHEIIVQRLASEPDNKQTFKPVQPREFVPFDYELSLGNLKKACAAHFNMPASTCDVLVSNKGPSCSNINQIPHRKDKVYLVRFVLQELDDQALTEDNLDNSSPEPSVTFQTRSSLLPTTRACKSASEICDKTPRNTLMETAYPASVSIDALLQAGKLVKPQPKNKVTLTFEKFDVKTREWVEIMEEEVLVNSKKFSAGAFRDAYHATRSTCKQAGGNQQSTQWVVKTYNAKALKTIEETLNTTVENHCRKQVQMHAVARHLAKNFELKAPPQFGKCFQYNRCFYTTYNDQPATVEEFVSGSFVKTINNNGESVEPPEGASYECKQLFAKAQCLVHYTYFATEKKLMLLDIQGSNYTLYDPEIATDKFMDEETSELYFCCGNCTTVGIETFLKGHTCNEFCKMMGLPDE